MEEYLELQTALREARRATTSHDYQCTVAAACARCGGVDSEPKALCVAAKLDDAAELFEIRHDAFESIRWNLSHYALET